MRKSRGISCVTRQACDKRFPIHRFDSISSSTGTTQNNRKQVTLQTRYTNQLTGWQWTQVYLGRIFLGVLAVIALWKIMSA